MNGDLWVGAVTALAGTTFGGGISFLVSRQQVKDARAQRAEAARREDDHRSIDRRLAAYSDFHASVRSFRAAIIPSRGQSIPAVTVQAIEALAQSAQTASSLVFLLLESQATHEACRVVVRIIEGAVTLIHEPGVDVGAVPWAELNREIGVAQRQFETAARQELRVARPRE